MLTGIGILALLSVKRPSAYARAVIPLCFALQQAAEGVVWITYGNPSSAALTQGASFLFLLFALVVWPLLIPFSLLIAEHHKTQWYQLLALTLIGIGVGGYGAQLLYGFPVSVAVTCHSIAYVYGNTNPLINALHAVGYVCVTVVPFFISTLRLTRILGVLLSGSLIAACWAWYAAATSVWCFFAALISSLIVVQLYLFE